MHFISYADSCSFTASYFISWCIDPVLDPQSILASSVPRCECLGRYCVHLQVCAAGLRSSKSLDGLTWMGCAHHIEEETSGWKALESMNSEAFLRFCWCCWNSWTKKATILVLELFGGKPQALSSSKTITWQWKMKLFFSKICWRWWFHIERDENCHPACRFLICQRLFPQVLTLHGSLLDDRAQLKALRGCWSSCIHLGTLYSDQPGLWGGFWLIFVGNLWKKCQPIQVFRFRYRKFCPDS